MGHLFKGVLALLFAASLTANADGKLEIGVKLSPAGSFKAETAKVQGHAYKTADGVAADDVVIDLRSLKTGIGLRDKHTKEHLLVQKYPEAKLVKATGKDGKGSAIIEIRGKKQKVEGTYKIEGNMLKAQFPMNLPDLDITDVKYMGVGVKDTVMVNLELPIKDGASRSTASKRK